MSFYSAEESFFLDAVASTTRPIVQIVPLTDTEVFQYLDAHPDALRRYFAERDGYVWSFIKTKSQGLPGGKAAPANQGNVTDGEARLRSLFDDEPVAVAEPEVIDEQAAASEGDGEEGDLPESELVSSLWEGAPLQSFSSSSPSSPLPSPPSPSPSPPSSPSPSPPPPPPPPSRPQKGSRKWTRAEEDSCIRHMLAIQQEDRIQGEARFRETQRRMKEIDGFERSGATSIKNFWNRIGRERSGFDERKNKKAPLATSQQGKSSRSSSSQSPASSAPGSSQAARKSSSPQERALLKHDSELESDDEQVHNSTNTSITRPAVMKRHKRDRDDSESEWEPDQSTINAIAKGIRGPKKARIAY
jgi:hypothetical protein